MAKSIPPGLLQLQRLFGESNVTQNNGVYAISLFVTLTEYPLLEGAIKELFQHLQHPLGEFSYNSDINNLNFHMVPSFIELPQNIEKLKQFTPNDFKNLGEDNAVDTDSNVPGFGRADIALFRLNRLAPGTDWIVTEDPTHGQLYRTRLPVANPRKALAAIKAVADIDLTLPPEGQGYATIPVGLLTEDNVRKLRDLDLAEALQRVVEGASRRA